MISQTMILQTRGATMTRVLAIVFLALTAAGCEHGRAATTIPLPTSPSSALAQAAPKTTFSLAGRVFDSTTGAAISDATVSFWDSMDTMWVRNTDTFGSYQFTAIPQTAFTSYNNYGIVGQNATIYVQAFGYLPTSKTLTDTFADQTLSFKMSRADVVQIRNQEFSQ
jgi:hypothetical protein